jgi:hypothetical protein
MFPNPCAEYKVQLPPINFLLNTDKIENQDRPTCYFDTMLAVTRDDIELQLDVRMMDAT